jgi:ABC-type transport system involved in cytochrome c biogenesis permease subunit
MSARTSFFTSSRLIAFCMLSSLLLLTGAAKEVDNQKGLDLWRSLPVYSDGRVQPLDSLARTAMRKVCDEYGGSIKIDMVRDIGISELYKNPANPKDGLRSDYKEIESMFEVDENTGLLKPRTFKPSELLLSWLVEGEKWNKIPIFKCQNKEFRKKLELPDEEGSGPKRVSIFSLQDADGHELFFAEYLENSRGKKDYQPTPLEEHLISLQQAIIYFQGVRFSPANGDQQSHSAFEGKKRTNVKELEEAVQDVFRVAAESLLVKVFESGEADQLLGVEAKANVKFADLDEDYLSFRKAYHEGGTWTDIQKTFLDFMATTKKIENQIGLLLEVFEKRRPPEGEEVPAQIKRQISTLRVVKDKTSVLYDFAKKMREAFLLTGDPIGIIPSLNSKALERGRDKHEFIVRPWIDLETLLHADKRLLDDYPHAPDSIDRLRGYFSQVELTYRQKNAPEFNIAMENFANHLDILAAETEGLRSEIFHAMDEDVSDFNVLKKTGRPEANDFKLIHEIKYNDLQPFYWACLTMAFASLFCVLSLVAAPRMFFWLGMALLFLGQVLGTYGFYLRIIVSGWAPVTNMYETLVFVPYMVSLMAVCFLFWPLVSYAVKASTRLMAFPLGFERRELEKWEKENVADWIWGSLGPVFMAVRVLLMIGFFALPFYISNSYNGAPDEYIGSELFAFPDLSEDGLNELLVWSAKALTFAVLIWYLPKLSMLMVMVPAILLYTGLREFPERIGNVYKNVPWAIAGTAVPFLGLAVAWYVRSSAVDDGFRDLPPVLRDNFWLTIHVLTIVASYGAGALAWGFGIMNLLLYTFGKYQPAPAAAIAKQAKTKPDSETSEEDGEQSSNPLAFLFGAGDAGPKKLTNRPPARTLEITGYIYKTMQVAVLLLVAGTILGGLWADVSWGRFWGWDPKEVWALISALVYLAILHGRFAGWIGPFGLCVGTVIGASSIIMSWYGVNFVLGAGLHSYGFGGVGDSKTWVFGILIANWVLTGVAAMRYTSEMTISDQPETVPEKSSADSE